MNESASVSAAQLELAGFVTRTRISDLPAELIERLRWSILDSLGCGLYGSTTTWGRIVSEFARTQGKGDCRIWADPRRARASGPAAALANATMIHSFEIDDVHYASRSHPGSVTVPVALALAESGKPLSGGELIAGLAVGYELLARVGACQGISSFNRGWHPTGTAGVFAAAATASRLLGLNAEACVHALGIAGTMPAGLMAAQFGAMVKRLYAGHTAWAGYSAALLASRGFTGIPDIFEAEYGGYLKAVSDEINVAALTQNLGTRFEAGTIGYKLHACVGTNHTALDAALQLRNQGGFTWREVEEVSILTSEYQVLHSGWEYVPSTVMAAQMNLQYCMAVLLMEGRVFVDQFTEALVRDPQILALAKRIRVAVKPGQNHSDRNAQVEIRLADGRRLQAECKAARGHPLNPPSWSDIEDKFMILAGKVLPPRRCRRIVQLVADIEAVPDVSELARLMVPTARKA